MLFKREKLIRVGGGLFICEMERQDQMRISNNGNMKIYLKMMKNVFYFTLKVLFVFVVLTFCACIKTT